jgi:putative oxidoreductase
MRPPVGAQARTALPEGDQLDTSTLLLIARILFVPIFLSSAIGHLRGADMMAGYAGSKGVPSPKTAVLVSGLVLLVGGLMTLLGVYADLGALLLVAFLIPTAVLMHAFWKETDPMARMTETIAFFKDLGLAGGALAMFALASVEQFGPTLTGPLF